MEVDLVFAVVSFAISNEGVLLCGAKFCSHGIAHHTFHTVEHIPDVYVHLFVHVLRQIAFQIAVWFICDPCWTKLQNS